MRRTTTLLLAAATSAAVVLPAMPAAADEYTCRGSVGARTLDNVLVPQGATCRLTGTTVKGTINVKGRATLVTSNVRVIGNVQAEGHRQVTLQRGRVGGSVQLKQGGGARVVSVAVTGDLQSFTNRGRQEFRSNRINGNLQCKENSPAPVGGANVVGGNKEDQCRRL